MSYLTKSSNSNINNGYIALFISALAFSLMSVCVKRLNRDIPIIEIVFIRSVISLIITSLKIKIKRLNPWGKNKALLFIRGLFGTLALYCVFRALGNLPLATATIIQYSYPTFTAIGAWFFLGEKTSNLIWIAIIIGWAGLTLTTNTNTIYANIESDNIEVIIAILGALLTSLAYICVRKLSKSENKLTIILYFPLVSCLCTLPLLINCFKTPSFHDFTMLIGVGLFTQLGQENITKGLSIIPAAKASAINYVQVIFASIWGILFFNEAITIQTYAGGILILIASLISIRSSNKKGEERVFQRIKVPK